MKKPGANEIENFSSLWDPYKPILMTLRGREDSVKFDHWYLCMKTFFLMLQIRRSKHPERCNREVFYVSFVIQTGWYSFYRYTFLVSVKNKNNQAQDIEEFFEWNLKTQFIWKKKHQFIENYWKYFRLGIMIH